MQLLILLDIFLVSTLMSKHVTPPQPASPVLNPPTSTAQTDARLSTNTSSSAESESNEPSVSNKQAPKSPLDGTNNLTTANSAILEHSAPESRDHSANSSYANSPTTTAGSIYPTLSMNALTEAASAGDASAQFELAKRFHQGIGVSVNYEEAIKWYTQSAEQGHYKAQNNLADMYYNGNGVEKDNVQAANWLKKAANQGSALTQYNLSIMYEAGEGVEQSDALAFSWCLESADQGYADAQYTLGLWYREGQGVNRDSSLAHSWFSKAADQGHAGAQYELGMFYRYGSQDAGIDKDISKAVDLFQKAANQGNAEAQCNLGWLYEQGYETYQDYDKAVYLHRLAADQGNLGSQESLGNMYQMGYGVKQSHEDAVIWFTKAAEQGSRSAQESLAQAYKVGQGVKKDLNRAAYWQMMCNVTYDGDCIEGRFLDLSLSTGLTEFIAQNLNERQEFEKITKLSFTKHSFSDDEIYGICRLIRTNLAITSLNIRSSELISKDNLLMLTEALEDNTQLTEILFNDYSGDSKIKGKIAALVARNVAIAELRSYVQQHSLKLTASFALDPLLIIIDKMIVSYLVSGNSQEDTKNAIDELFASASLYNLEENLNNQMKQ